MLEWNAPDRNSLRHEPARNGRTRNGSDSARRSKDRSHSADRRGRWRCPSACSKPIAPAATISSIVARSPSDIAAHVRSFLVSRQEGFQPTQMLSTSDTALSGTLSHLDLPGVIQMLGQARQTGALHINAGDTDGIIFFEGGEIVHAECGTFFGDEAVTQIVRTCHERRQRRLQICLRRHRHATHRASFGHRSVARRHARIRRRATRRRGTGKIDKR